MEGVCGEGKGSGQHSGAEVDRVETVRIETKKTEPRRGDTKMKHTNVTASGLKYVEICPGFENATEGLQ